MNISHNSLYSLILLTSKQRLSSWWNDRRSHDKWIFLTIVLFIYFAYFEAKFVSWLDNRRSHHKWILLTIVLFTYFACFEAKLWVIRWSKITWQMNISHDSSIHLFCLFRSKVCELFRWSKITWQMNTFHNSSIHLFCLFRSKVCQLIH